MECGEVGDIAVDSYRGVTSMGMAWSLGEVILMKSRPIFGAIKHSPHQGVPEQHIHRIAQFEDSAL